MLIKEKKQSLLFFFLLLPAVFFFTLLSPSYSYAGFNDFSFNLHAPYNSFGSLNLKREPALDYVTGQILKLGKIETIRNSGETGLVPKVKPESFFEDQKCLKNKRPEEEYLCRTAEFVADSHRGWSYIDGPINHASSIGLDIILEVNLFERVNDKRYKRTQENVDTMVELVNQALDRYQGKVKYWQIGNEPGANKWTTEEKTNDGKILLGYATVQVAKAVRQKCPDCKIVLAGVGGHEGWKGYYGELFRYFNEVGYKDAFDVVDFHVHHMHYANFESGKYEKIEEFANGFRQLFQDHGYSNKAIWITETSSWSGSPIHQDTAYPFHNENAQAAELIKRFTYAFLQQVKKVFWSPGIIDYKAYGGKEKSYFNNIGLIYGWGEKKTSFETLRILAKKLDGFTSVEKVDMGNPSIYLLKFQFDSGKKPVYVFWEEMAPGSAPSEYSLKGKLDYDNVLITSLRGTNTLLKPHNADSLTSVKIAEHPKIIEFAPQAVSLECPAQVLGNLNCDPLTFVNNDDLQVLLNSWQTSKTSSPADLNDDQKVDEADLNILLKKWKTK